MALNSSACTELPSIINEEPSGPGHQAQGAILHPDLLTTRS